MPTDKWREEATRRMQNYAYGYGKETVAVCHAAAIAAQLVEEAVREERRDLEHRMVDWCDRQQLGSDLTRMLRNSVFGDPDAIRTPQGERQPVLRGTVRYFEEGKLKVESAEFPIEPPREVCGTCGSRNPEASVSQDPLRGCPDAFHRPPVCVNPSVHPQPCQVCGEIFYTVNIGPLCHRCGKHRAVAIDANKTPLCAICKDLRPPAEGEADA